MPVIPTEPPNTGQNDKTEDSAGDGDHETEVTKRKDRDIRILSLDGGGTRGIVHLLILKRIFNDNRMRHIKPCHFFDLLVGTSMGGIVAVLLGKLQFTIDQALEVLDNLVQTVCKPILFSRYRYDARLLEEEIKRIISFENDVDTVAIWQALRATCADSRYYESIVINGVRYVDGGLLSNNPSVIAIRQAQQLFPGKRIGILYSLGTGAAKPIEANTRSARSRIVGNLISTSAQPVAPSLGMPLLPYSSRSQHQEASRICNNDLGTHYFRFDPPFVGDLDIDGNNLEKLRDFTEAYLDDPERQAQMRESLYGAFAIESLGPLTTPLDYWFSREVDARARGFGSRTLEHPLLVTQLDTLIQALQAEASRLKSERTDVCSLCGGGVPDRALAQARPSGQIHEPNRPQQSLHISPGHRSPSSRTGRNAQSRHQDLQTGSNGGHYSEHLHPVQDGSQALKDKRTSLDTLFANSTSNQSLHPSSVTELQSFDRETSSDLDLDRKASRPLSLAQSQPRQPRVPLSSDESSLPLNLKTSISFSSEAHPMSSSNGSNTNRKGQKGQALSGIVTSQSLVPEMARPNSRDGLCQDTTVINTVSEIVSEGTGQSYISRLNDTDHRNTTISVPSATATTSITRHSARSPTLKTPFCSKCNQPIKGTYAKALNELFHLDCFRCQDCNSTVVNKFWPIDAPHGKQHPLCETDYFRRLNLICAKCGMALRGSYITALDMKFHVEHFTCSVCSTIFGPQDSYYEHGGQVYCHFHYSTRFAVKCPGCQTAILKQFVEINRDDVDEHLHPECYLIQKFWNIKLVTSAKKQIEASPATVQAGNSGDTASSMEHSQVGVASTLLESMGKANVKDQILSSRPSVSSTSVDWSAQEASETARTLREQQQHAEAQVSRTWTVLSSFEESAAACISNLLCYMSNGRLSEGMQMAEDFVLHVETLFAAIDDLSDTFRTSRSRDIPHVREARMLCKKLVNLFTILSRYQEAKDRKMETTQESLALVTSLAHYLKILIRIALGAALKAGWQDGQDAALSQFLVRLGRLCRDPDTDTALRPRGPSTIGSFKADATIANAYATLPAVSQRRARQILSMAASQATGNDSVAGIKFRDCGYKSLLRPGITLVNQSRDQTKSDLCESCQTTIEEDCVRLGTTLRWQLKCLICSICERHASQEEAESERLADLIDEDGKSILFPKDFHVLLLNRDKTEADRKSPGKPKPSVRTIICSTCSQPDGFVRHQDGFQYVTRLEQYAFLLYVALDRLQLHLEQRDNLISSQYTQPEKQNLTSNSREREDLVEASAYETSRDETTGTHHLERDDQNSTPDIVPPKKKTSWKERLGLRSLYSKQ